MFKNMLCESTSAIGVAVKVNAVNGYLLAL